MYNAKAESDIHVSIITYPVCTSRLHFYVHTRDDDELVKLRFQFSIHVLKLVNVLMSFVAFGFRIVHSVVQSLTCPST